MESVKITAEEEHQPSSYVDHFPSLRAKTLAHGCSAVDRLNEGSSVTQRQVFQQRLSPHELAHQEHLIQEREQDIREVETGIHELAEIFHDLRTFVIGQGDMLGASV